MNHLVNILRTATITIVVTKSIKIAGKKDIADVIAMSGWMLCGYEGLKIIEAIRANPPAIFMLLYDIGIALDKIASVLNQMLGGAK